MTKRQNNMTRWYILICAVLAVAVVVLTLWDSTRIPAPDFLQEADPIVAAGYLRIGINSASFEELQELPGIGPALAEAILAYRAEHGGFDTLEELMEVKGIGPATYEKLKMYLSLE